MSSNHQTDFINNRIISSRECIGDIGACQDHQDTIRTDQQISRPEIPTIELDLQVQKD